MSKLATSSHMLDNGFGGYMSEVRVGGKRIEMFDYKTDGSNDASQIEDADDMRDAINDAFDSHPVVMAARLAVIAHLTNDPVAKAEAVVALIDAFKE